MKIKIIKTQAKSIFARTKLPGADFVINQYVGCAHSCLYCYAKFMCRWKLYGKWGSWVEAKINAPELVNPAPRANTRGIRDMSSRLLSGLSSTDLHPWLWCGVKGKYVKGRVFMSSVSDSYQPIEKKLKLTRRILKNLDKRIKLSILTKSDLVLRDIDLFKKFKNIEIGLTINGFKGRPKRFLNQTLRATMKD